VKKHIYMMLYRYIF